MALSDFVLNRIRALFGARLHVYADDSNFVIAYSLADAFRVMKKDLGFGTSDIYPDEWEEVADDAEISIHCDSDGHPTEPGSDDDAGVITATAEQWLKRGRGLLCTLDW